MKSIVTSIAVIISTLSLYGCQPAVKSPPAPSKVIPPKVVVTPKPKPSQPPVRSADLPLIKRLLQAEVRASNSGRKILRTGRKMTLVNKEIVRGSCWDYADTVYQRAGFSRNRQHRQTIFKGSKRRGPYADIRKIQPGDFLYFINHSYHNVEHSSIFIDWENINKKLALMLSYGGQNRRSPARYKVYNLSHVYRITRPTKR